MYTSRLCYQVYILLMLHALSYVFSASLRHRPLSPGFSNARHPLPSSSGQVLLPLENLEPQERFTSLYRCSMLSSPATASFEILAFPRIQFLLSASLSRFKGKRFFGVHPSPQVGVFQLWTSRRSEIFLSLSLSAGNIRNQGSSKGKDVQSNHTPRLLKVSQYLHVTT